MKEFYEPMLYMSTPEHPNTMGVSAVLTEPIDGALLTAVIEELRSRFPYFYVRAVPEDNDLRPVENPLPMTVRNTWAPITLNAPESNYHLAAWKYEGKRLAFEISHSLTDGAGTLPYFKSVLYLYLSRKTGKALDPEGFHLPGDEIPESESGNPFAGLDIDGAQEPMYQKQTTADFYRLDSGAEGAAQLLCVKLSEAQLMQYCKDFDGSPNTFLAVMLARAARRYDPESEKTVSIAIAIDHKAMLGVRENYRMFANVVELDFPKNRALDDLLRACTGARGQVMLQAQPETSLWVMKQRKQTFAKLAQLPLEAKLGALRKSAGAPRWSFSLSYTNSRSFGPLDPYIEELYVLSEPGVTDLNCEIACINHCFFLAIIQRSPYDRFIDTFLAELKSVGIDYDVLRSEPLGLSGIAPYSV